MSGTKISYEQFVTNAVRKLRNPKYKGIHVVYSGFNQAFRQYYGEDPRLIIDKMVADGFIVLRLVRGGAIMTLTADLSAEERKIKESNSSTAALTKILS